MSYYDTKELIQFALKVIVDEQCVTMEEVWLMMAVSKQTAYNHGLDKVDEIKEAVYLEKVKRKKKLRRNWVNSDNATLQIAEFKLCADDEELNKLNTQKTITDISVHKGRVIFTSDESASS